MREKHGAMHLNILLTLKPFKVQRYEALTTVGQKVETGRKISKEVTAKWKDVDLARL